MCTPIARRGGEYYYKLGQLFAYEIFLSLDSTRVPSTWQQAGGREGKGEDSPGDAAGGAGLVGV